MLNRGTRTDKGKIRNESVPTQLVEERIINWTVFMEASGSSKCEEWRCIDYLYDGLCCIRLLVNVVREAQETHRTIRCKLMVMIQTAFCMKEEEDEKKKEKYKKKEKKKY